MDARSPSGKRRFCTVGDDEDMLRASADWDMAPASERGGGAASSSSTVCFFYSTSEGCKKGSQCKWRHIDTNGTGKFSDGWQSKTWRDYGGGKGATWSSTTYKNPKYRSIPCSFYQTGCCFYDADCFFAHELAQEEANLRTRLCAAVLRGLPCQRVDCPDAHGKHELETPRMFEGMPGYKACLCTSHVTEGLGCQDDPCFYAHGELEKRRMPLATPRSLARQEFFFSDSHVHLDHVLYSRKHGCYWFLKYQKCKRNRPYCIYGSGCMFWHEGEKRIPRPIVEQDFKDLFAEVATVSGTFAGCVHNCCDESDIDMAVRLVEWGRRHLEGKIYVTFGVHPTNFEDWTDEVCQRLEDAIRICGKQVVGWGECGLDYYRRGSDIEADAAVREQMKDVFRKQALGAVRRGLPLVVHSRDAEDDTLSVLYTVVPQTHPVHLHSFMGSVECLKEFLRRYHNGYYGVAGCVTYEGVQLYEGGLKGLVQACPLERLLLETDGPFMAPKPYRGEESHPGQIPWVAEGVAKIKGVSVQDVLAAAHINFCRLYGIPPR